MYKTEILPDGSMELIGQYGKYRISDAQGGFEVAPLFDTYVEEFDGSDESFLIEQGKTWFSPFGTISEMNAFLKRCEDEKLWNIMPGPMFRFKINDDSNAVFLKGESLVVVISKTDTGFKASYPETKQVREIDGDISSLCAFLVSADRWWDRPGDEAAAMSSSMKGVLKLTSGGNMRFDSKDRTDILGQKEDGTFWVCDISGDERHIYFVDTFADALKVISEKTPGS